MERGTLYFLGSSSAIGHDGKAVVVETLQVDTETDAAFYTRIDGVTVEYVPYWAADAMAAATKHSHRISKMDAKIWLMN